MHKLIGIFWPLASHPQPNAITRLGRLVHWMALALSALLALMAATAFQSWTDGAVFFGVALAVALTGSGVRYVLSGE